MIHREIFEYISPRFHSVFKACKMHQVPKIVEGVNISAFLHNFECKQTADKCKQKADKKEEKTNTKNKS